MHMLGVYTVLGYSAVMAVLSGWMTCPVKFRAYTFIYLNGYFVSCHTVAVLRPGSSEVRGVGYSWFSLLVESLYKSIALRHLSSVLYSRYASRLQWIMGDIGGIARYL